MSVASSLAVSVNGLPEWSLLFAKEPAPAADPAQPDMDKTVVLGPPGKKGPTPPSMKERILFLVLILVIVGAGGYLAYNPDILMGLLGDAPGETPPPQLAPKVAKPATPAPAPAPAAAPAAPPAPAAPAAAPAPGSPAATAPAPAAPKPATPMPAAVAAVPAPAPAPTAPAAPPAPMAAASAPKPATPGVPSIPTPKFGEGEKVSVSAPTPLTADSAGKKPGTATAAPGSTLVVLDADLQSYAWVYSVRTEQGATGWVAEKNLVAK
jgi:hypothetical protein